MKFLIFYAITMTITIIALLCETSEIEEISCYVNEFEKSKYKCTGDGCDMKYTCRLYKNYLNDN